MVSPCFSPNAPRAYRVEVRKASGEWEEVAKVTPPAEKAASNVAELLAVIGRLAHELSALQPPPLFAGFFRPPEKTHLLGRGDPMDPREEVAPNALSALNATSGSAVKQVTRCAGWRLRNG